MKIQGMSISWEELIYDNLCGLQKFESDVLSFWMATSE